MIHPDRFLGRLGSMLALIGVAIGLGNVWRFPYQMGAHGGSAFLMMYLAMAALFAVPMLSAEFALGRALRSGLIDSYRKSLGPRTGSVLGSVLALALLVANSYYMVVIGNIVYLTGFGIRHGFSTGNASELANGLGNGDLQYVCALLVLVAGTAVLLRGVRGGIEAVSRWCVPFFGLIVLYLVGYVFTLEGVAEQLRVFLRPDFSTIGIREVFAAIGQACFSLSVGGTFMVVYGSYLNDDTSLLKMAAATAIGDTGAALIAALFIVPAVLHFGLDMAAGPGLVFNTLPKLFALMPGGHLAGSLFLLAFLLMAFLSAVAALEVCMSALRDLTGWRIGRRGAALSVGALEVLLMWPSAHHPALIATLDMVFGSGMQVFGAIIALLALTWGLGAALARQQLFGASGGRGQFAYLFWLRWVVPGILSIIFVLYLLDTFRSVI